MIYKFQNGRWHYSADNGATWTRTRYDKPAAPAPAYRDANPKLDLYDANGAYIGSTNWHATACHAFAWYAVVNPALGVAIIRRAKRR